MRAVWVENGFLCGQNGGESATAGIGGSAGRYGRCGCGSAGRFPGGRELTFVSRYFWFMGIVVSLYFWFGEIDVSAYFTLLELM
jgi:hypothetical protein